MTALTQELEYMIESMTRDCPRCGAPVSAPCMTGGGLIRSPHGERRKLVEVLAVDVPAGATRYGVRR